MCCRVCYILFSESKTLTPSFHSFTFMLLQPGAKGLLDCDRNDGQLSNKTNLLTQVAMRDHRYDRSFAESKLKQKSIFVLTSPVTQCLHRHHSNNRLSSCHLHTHEHHPHPHTHTQMHKYSTYCVLPQPHLFHFLTVAETISGSHLLPLQQETQNTHINPSTDFFVWNISCGSGISSSRPVEVCKIHNQRQKVSSGYITNICAWAYLVVQTFFFLFI